LKLSVIIPTFNEAGQIGPLIGYLIKVIPAKDFEIIVTDGGSNDGTIREAEVSGALVTRSESRGRASQMNHAARFAKGRVLYFLHADSKPPPDFYEQITGAIQGGAEAGCFRLKFDDSHKLLRSYSWFTRFDIDLFRFGDQSLFIKKNVFNEIKGFDEKLVVMEDQEIVRRIRKVTDNFVILREPVITSARKYRANGVVRLQLIFILIVILYYCGASQEVLGHFYKSFLRPHPTQFTKE
jgi:rSAM/selenodomain-associated transferase 2